MEIKLAQAWKRLKAAHKAEAEPWQGDRAMCRCWLQPITRDVVERTALDDLVYTSWGTSRHPNDIDPTYELLLVLTPTRCGDCGALVEIGGDGYAIEWPGPADDEFICSQCYAYR